MEMELDRKKGRPVAIWLMVGVFLIIVQIILGGITRLTDSGLSITEWQPILGTIPPNSEQEWQQAFDKYKQIAQFKHLHSYFTLEDFKSIYFWEWLHRVWGRFIGVVFAIPFVIFLLQKRFTRAMVRPMIILFLLGGLQGVIGWIMVQSGLNNEDLYVSHIRLAIHFILALVLLVYTYWFALQLLVPPGQKVLAPTAKNILLTIIMLLVIQLTYGAFMAGLKAATSAPTWPTINGDYVPPVLNSYGGKSHSFFSALVNNPITVQFIHRNLAYIIILLVIAWNVVVYRLRAGSLFNKTKWWPLVLTLVQTALGVGAVLTSPYQQTQRWGTFEWYAQLHQFIAILLLLSLFQALFLLGRAGNKELLNSDSLVDTHAI